MTTVFEGGTILIDYAAGTLLIAACAVASTNLLLFFLNKLVGTEFTTVASFTEGAKKVPVQLTRVRFQLGSSINVALTLMVAADVLETFTQPAAQVPLEGYLKLVIIAFVRTSLAFFLGKEMKECEEELEKFDEVDITV